MAQAVEALPQDVGAAKPTLVFFHSRFCGKSRRVEGFIAQVLQRRRNHGTFVFLPVEADERPDLFARFNVDEVPSLLVVSNRQVRGRLMRPRGCRDIEGLLAPWLK